MFQSHRVVVLRVMRAVEQRDRAALGGLYNRLPGLRPRIEFGEILPLKVLPFFRVVSKPFPQFSTRTGFLFPPIGPKIGFADSSWPQPLYEKAHSIVWPGLVIHAFQVNHG